MKRRKFILSSLGLSALSLPLVSAVKDNLKQGVVMIAHPSETRGIANHGWLQSRFSFSFADYYNPERMGFGALRVINDDSIAPGMGFGTHPHRDMEIITIPLEGTLAHKDSTGNAKFIKKGEVQIMSAGTGIFHSEVNASQSEVVKLLQIWVLPGKLNVEPRYEQKLFSHDGRKNKFSTVVSPDGREGSVTINQNAFFSLIDLDGGNSASYARKASGNGVYVFIIRGNVEIDGKAFKARDGVGITDFEAINLSASSDAEILLMEIPV